MTRGCEPSRQQTLCEVGGFFFECHPFSVKGRRQAAKQDKDVRPRVPDEEWKKMLVAAKIQEMSVLEFFRRLSLAELPSRTRLSR